ncbi:hypothetical protein VNO78_12433 [Psophocarpus tetragonolobus]|uniref:CobN/magnesium chelatase domain-containing protein n=1 Tax=Psophocarpus tetragonolobus TaxID=3891 RepID=A0AAN9SP40_PSOTE
MLKLARTLPKVLKYLPSDKKLRKPLAFQTTEEWLSSVLGLHPIQVALQVALPERDGVMEPIVFLEYWSNKRKSHALRKRVETALRQGNEMSRIEKKIKEVLIEDVIYDKQAQFSSPNLNIAFKMSVHEYQNLTPYATTLEENWGKLPGNLNADGENLLVYGKQYGNVFIGVQPTFGYEEDPRGCFSPNLPVLITDLQHIIPLLKKSSKLMLYFILGHMVRLNSCLENSQTQELAPLAENAGLYKGLKQLSELISSYQSLKDTGRGAQIMRVKRSHLKSETLWLERCMEIESRLLPCGLHVIGEPPSALEAVATLVNVAVVDRPEEEASRGAITAFAESTTNNKGQVVDVANKLSSILGFGINEPWNQYLSNTKFYRADREKLRTVFEFLGACLKLIVADNELGSLKQALEGKYVEPGPGGDPIRNPKVLPTCKNIHTLDPQAIPTTAAMQSVALVLWGTDNIKTCGESLAQVLWMIGVTPVADTFGRVNQVEPVSLEELGRPRIDVVVNCSGVFRDLFINQILLLLFFH